MQSEFAYQVTMGFTKGIEPDPFVCLCHSLESLRATLGFTGQWGLMVSVGRLRLARSSTRQAIGGVYTLRAADKPCPMVSNILTFQETQKYLGDFIDRNGPTIVELYKDDQWTAKELPTWDAVSSHPVWTRVKTLSDMATVDMRHVD